MREALKTVTKDSNKLKAKKCLDSGNHHSGFFDHRSCLFFEASRPRSGVVIFRWHSRSFVLFALDPLKNAAAHLLTSDREFLAQTQLLSLGQNPPSLLHFQYMLLSFVWHLCMLKRH